MRAGRWRKQFVNCPLIGAEGLGAAKLFVETTRVFWYNTCKFGVFSRCACGKAAAVMI